MSGARRAEDERRACVECGGPVEPPERGPIALYCSPACRQRAYRRRVKVEREAFRARMARPPTRPRGSS